MVPMTRSLVLAMLFALSTSACTASREQIKDALDDIHEGLTIADESLKVTGELYEQYCALRPDCKACKGDTAEQIRALLVMGPLTVGQIREILAKVNG